MPVSHIIGLMGIGQLHSLELSPLLDTDYERRFSTLYNDEIIAIELMSFCPNMSNMKVAVCFYFACGNDSHFKSNSAN